MQQKRKRTHNGFCRGLSVLSSIAVLWYRQCRSCGQKNQWDPAWYIRERDMKEIWR